MFQTPVKPMTALPHLFSRALPFLIMTSSGSATSVGSIAAVRLKLKTAYPFYPLEP